MYFNITLFSIKGISRYIYRLTVKSEGLETCNCTVCLHATSEGDLSIDEQSSQESTRIDDDVPTEVDGHTELLLDNI